MSKELVIGTKGIDSIDEGQTPLDLGHVGGEFVVLHRHHQVLARAQDFGGAGRALPQHTPEALSPPDECHPLQQRLRVAEAKFNVIGVLQRDQPPLEAIRRPGDRRPAGDGIHPVHVAQLISTHFASAFTASGSASSGRLRPRTATAFRFLDAIAVPIPVRPLARLALLISAPKRTPFSPAGPH